jgi:hypothetical protein
MSDNDQVRPQDQLTDDLTTPATSAEPSTAPGTGTGWGATVVPTPERRGVRVGTVVWGLVLAAVGVGLLAWASGLVFDVQLAVILLVAAAGVALLVGSLVGGRRRGR